MSNDSVLTFSAHDLGIHCYNGVTNVRLVYAGTPHEICFDAPARDKTAADENRKPSGTYGTYHAFSGPAEIDWLSRDGSALSLSLNLDEIFPDRIVLHKDDPARIYRTEPITTGQPLIVIEIIDRTVNVYMALRLQLLKPGATDGPREGSKNYTLAYSKTV